MTEQTKYLAEHLLIPAVVNQAIDEAMQATERLRTDLDDNEANVALNKALDKVIAAVEARIMGPSPRLTDEENDQYIALNRKRRVERRSGDIKWHDTIKLSDEEELLYQKLEAKADGRNF